MVEIPHPRSLLAGAPRSSYMYRALFTSYDAFGSGTIGAALAASMANIPAVAISYGIFDKPIPEGCVEKAHEIACVVIETLCKCFHRLTFMSLYAIFTYRERRLCRRPRSGRCLQR